MITVSLSPRSFLMVAPAMTAWATACATGNGPWERGAGIADQSTRAADNSGCGIEAGHTEPQINGVSVPEEMPDGVVRFANASGST